MIGEAWLEHHTTATVTRPEGRASYPYVWRIRRRLPDRYGQRCRVLVRGTMNSALIAFPDGFTVVTSRNFIRIACDLCGRPGRRLRNGGAICTVCRETIWRGSA